MYIHGGSRVSDAKTHVAEVERLERKKAHKAFCGAYIHPEDIRREGLPDQNNGNLCALCKKAAVKRGLWAK